MASLELWRRAGKLLGRHVWMTILFVAVAVQLGGASLIGEFRMQAILTDPWTALAALPFLAWQPVFMDILPLFVLAMAVLPLAMLAPWDRPLLGLAPWLALWLIVQATGLHLPTWPDARPWTFNPLSWLPLFMRRLDRTGGAVRRPACPASALAFDDCPGGGRRGLGRARLLDLC
jgi:hypothetical protein